MEFAVRKRMDSVTIQPQLPLEQTSDEQSVPTLHMPRADAIRQSEPRRSARSAASRQRIGGSRFQILEGDAYERLLELPKNSVDLLLTSPPYWGHRTYGQTHDWSILTAWTKAGHAPEDIPPYQWYREHGGVLGLEPLPEWYVAHLSEILNLAQTSLKPTGSMWINIGDTYFARWSSIRHKGRQGLGSNPRERRRTPMGGFRQEKQLLLIPSRFAIAMQDRRWILRNDLIWYKPNVPPRPENDRLRLAHEHFFHFVKRPKEGRAKYYYDMEHLEPRATDVVTCNVRAGQDGHSATFPIDLIRPRILSSCPPGGVVLDPFCGTGRALTVALEEGRQAIGIEIVPEYATNARQHALRAANANVGR